MSPLLEVRGLTAGYGRTTVLEGLDLSVEAGELVAVVGANGTGKSTLLRCLASLHPSDHEHATLAGLQIGTPAARSAASLAGDEPVFFTDISVDEQLHYLCALGAVKRAADHVDEILARLGLDDRRNDIPTTMSRGWRQRASLACALARGAPLLCVDEPFVGLDAAGRVQLLDTFEWYRSDGRAIVVATHDLPGLGDLTDRVLRISD
jgi:ABC-2 type transport system ATP-binding protein